MVDLFFWTNNTSTDTDTYIQKITEHRSSDQEKVTGESSPVTNAIHTHMYICTKEVYVHQYIKKPLTVQTSAL
jgi:hypothetical protein